MPIKTATTIYRLLISSYLPTTELIFFLPPFCSFHFVIFIKGIVFSLTNDWSASPYEGTYLFGFPVSVGINVICTRYYNEFFAAQFLFRSVFHCHKRDHNLLPVRYLLASVFHCQRRDFFGLSGLSNKNPYLVSCLKLQFFIFRHPQEIQEDQPSTIHKREPYFFRFTKN